MLQLVLRDPRVHRRRLNVRVPQVLLHHAEIAAGTPMQLDPAAVTERMRVKLGETRPPAESLDDLPDPVVGHTTLLPVASAAAVTHRKHRVLTSTTNPLVREVFRHNDFRHLGEGYGRLVPALATHTPQTELRRV